MGGPSVANSGGTRKKKKVSHNITETIDIKTTLLRENITYC